MRGLEDAKYKFLRSVIGYIKKSQEVRLFRAFQQLLPRQEVLNECDDPRAVVQFLHLKSALLMAETVVSKQNICFRHTSGEHLQTLLKCVPRPGE